MILASVKTQFYYLVIFLLCQKVLAYLVIPDREFVPFLVVILCFLCLRVI